MRAARNLAAALVVAAVLSLVPTPAQAGSYSWTPTNCHGQAPYSNTSYELGLNGPPTWSAWISNAYTYRQTQWEGRWATPLRGKTYTYYVNSGLSCGWLGLPWRAGTYVSPNPATQPSYVWTYFVRPNDCTLYYTVELTSGPNAGWVGWYSVAHYFGPC